MPRTTANRVIDILGDNYGPKADGTLPNLAGYIRSANNVVNQVVNLNSAGSVAVPYSHSTSELCEMETWLAAHFYCVMDPIYTSRSTQGATGAFQRSQAGEGFEATEYGKQAVHLDPSGALNALSKRLFAGCAWLGTPVDDQKDASER